MNFMRKTVTHRRQYWFLIAFVLCLPNLLQGADGDLDPSFDSDGKVITDIQATWDLAHDIAIQSDGKIVAVGAAFSNDPDFAVVRYNSNGSLDMSFSGDAKAILEFAPGQSDVPRSVAIQSDGKIVVLGYSTNPAGYDFALARLNTDGSLDTTFSSDGKLLTDFGEYDDDGSSVLIQTDGKIVAAGYSHEDFAFARYNSDGSLDTSFSGDGKVIVDFGDFDYGAEIAIQSDGRIVAVGYSRYNQRDFAVARLNSDGSLDTTFSGDGKVTTEFGGDEVANGVVIQSDGKIVVGGHTDNGSSQRDFAVARYNSDGSLDSTFSVDGKVITDFGTMDDWGGGIVLQSDGKIIVAGITKPGDGDYDFALARYHSNGNLDSNFSADGKTSIDFGGLHDYTSDLVIQNDNRIVVLGSTDSGLFGDFALARFLSGTPTANSDSFSTPQDVTLNIPAPGILGNDTDIDGDPLTATLQTGTFHGSLTLNSDGSFVYTPNAGYNGPDNFTYIANDGTADSNIAVVSIIVGCLFCDDFEDGEASNWTFTKGMWSVVGGDLTGIVNKMGDAVSPDFGGCTNCTFEANVRIQTAGGRISLLGWFQDKKNLVELRLMEDKNKILLKQKVGRATVAKAKFLQTINTDTDYRIRVTYEGTNFLVYLNDTLVMTVPAGAVPNGNAAFRVKSTSSFPTTGSMDDIVIY